MTDVEDQDGFADKYWICSNCAEKKKWTLPNWAVTCMMGKCAYCKIGIDTTLTPIVDFSRPGKAAVWD